LADQAKGPFLNPVEMALGSEADVVRMVRSSWYTWLFETVFPGVLYDDAKIGIAYNNIATAIAAFERSLLLNRFTSKFDRFVMEQGGDVSTFGVTVDPATGFRKYFEPPPGFRSRYFSYKEADSLTLFNADSEVQLKTGSGKNVGGMCYFCHLTTRHNPDFGPNSTQPANPLRSDGTYPPLLTDFSYVNLGIPKNPRIVELTGSDKTDYGLGASERVTELHNLNPDLIIENGIAAEEQGKHKVSTLRDIDKTAPYGHNGFFPTLYSIVHFYNTRDNPWSGESFSPSEVPGTVNKDELGNLGLTYQQEQKIVLFLKTLSDI
jgi:cytochrome c peroxidase